MAKKVLWMGLLAVAVFAIYAFIYYCAGESNDAVMEKNVKLAKESNTTESESDDVVDEIDNPYLVLVNMENRLPDGFVESITLENAMNFFGEEMQIETLAYRQFARMREELLLRYDIQIELDSVYRSVEEQEELWNEFTEEYGEDYAEQYLAEPGYSEHHTGLAVDIFVIKNGSVIRENDDMIADVEDFAVIHKILPNYGFILRYPEGKEDITGYAYEPWHLRYVDSIRIAREITDEGLTLEEYLQKQK